jgi:hypothetical protein
MGKLLCRYLLAVAYNMRSVKYTESHYPLQADVLTLFDARSRWILLGNAARGYSLLAELRILLDSDVLTAGRVSERSFMLLEMYRRHNDTIIKTVIGEWGHQYGLWMTASPVLSSRRTNFHRSVLKAVMVVRQNRVLCVKHVVNMHIRGL